jgi:hypothetical protein
MDSKLVASGIYDALGDADVDLRARMPDVFAKVDTIKATPEWYPFRLVHGVGADPETYVVAECRWCGDPFVQSRHDHKTPRCCSGSCAQRLAAFNRRRHRAA